VRDETRAFVEDWWAEMFGCPDDRLWQGVHVARHAKLGDYGGAWVAWRDTGVHVSLPVSVTDEDADSLAAQGFERLTDPEFWRAWGAGRGWVLVGPSVHAYLDEDPGDDGSVPQVHPALLAPLRSAVTAEEWQEAGMDDENEHGFGCFAHGGLVAASVLSDFGDAPRDIGVLVATDFRGRGLAHRVGGAAASYAVRHHGFATWRAFHGNCASRAVAAELGFEPYADQLAVRAAR
jgi:RimJ/RimL family protein N-acetyltransferase